MQEKKEAISTIQRYSWYGRCRGTIFADLEKQEKIAVVAKRCGSRCLSPVLIILGGDEGRELARSSLLEAMN
jgi:hypothetical protein